MRKNRTLELLRNNQTVYGTWLVLGSTHVARLLAAQGAFDWLIIDFEHSPLDHSTISTMISSISDISQGRVTPLVRVTAGTIHHIKMALDSGAQGVIVPLVSTAQEARDIVSFSRFPPLGVRGVGGLLPHLSFSSSRSEYITHANKEIIVGIIIETKTAIENIDSILSVEGIDLVLLGGVDLQMTMGLPPTLWSDEPEFLNAVKILKEACLKYKIPLGILCPDAGSAQKRVEEGFEWIGVGNDASLLLSFAGQQADIARGGSGVGNLGDSLKGLGL